MSSSMNKTFSLKPTVCLFCGPAPSKTVFREHLSPESFTGYAFSARRERRRTHYRIVRCERCGLVRSDPVLDESSINALYTESKFLFSGEEAYAAKTYADLLGSLLPRMGGVEKNRRLIEIGCSTGFFLKEAVRLGCDQATGFEPSRECVERADPSLKGRIINDVYRPDAVAGKEFDLVCSFHVFDHLADPLGLLRSAMERLRPGGSVLVVCHDVGAASARILGDFSPIFDVEHIYLFSMKTMRMLFEQAGLEIVEIGTLKNRYPMGYWLRMAPLVGGLVRCLPRAARDFPIALNAGNLYAVGRKKENVPC